MATMNKEQFKALLAKPISVKQVEYEGNVFHIKSMNEKEGVEYELAIADKEGNIDWAKARRAMLATMLVDEAGNKLVDSASEIEVMDLALAEFLWSECRPFARGKAKEVDDLRKKSEEVQG
jgi:hypothetical protein